VRIGGQYLLERVFGHGLGVLAGEQLKQAPLAGERLRVPVAALLRAKDAEIHPEHVQDLGHRLGDQLDAWVIGAVIADEPQHVYGFLVVGQYRHRHGEILGPVGPLPRRLAEGVAVTAGVAQCGLQLLRDAPADEHFRLQRRQQSPGQRDLDRADARAGKAGDTQPDGVALQHPVPVVGPEGSDQRPGRVVHGKAVWTNAAACPTLETLADVFAVGGSPDHLVEKLV